LYYFKNFFAKWPFPALVECHGGAWCLSDRATERLRHEAMAKNGIVSIALDFRSGL
jgi:acetyl esterase